MMGLFDSLNQGFDELNLTLDQNATNGVVVDYGYGIQGDINSAFIGSYGGDNGSVGFNFNNFEKINLTDNADYMYITDGVGAGISQGQDSHYFTTSQSVMTIDPGKSGTGVDRIDLDGNNNIHLSYNSLDSDSHVSVNISDNDAAIVTGSWGGTSINEVIISPQIKLLTV